jgi:hypothetical protein
VPGGCDQCLEYVYYLENCDTASRDVKLSEHMHNHLDSRWPKCDEYIREGSMLRNTISVLYIGVTTFTKRNTFTSNTKG